jgi:hypothetical protein
MINLRIAAGSCSPAMPARVYVRSNPWGATTRNSQFSLARDPGHSPVPSSFAQCVFDSGRDFLRQPGISEVLEFWGDSHCSVIVSNNICSSPCANLVNPRWDAVRRNREHSCTHFLLKIAVGIERRRS